MQHKNILFKSITNFGRVGIVSNEQVGFALAGGVIFDSFDCLIVCGIVLVLIVCFLAVSIICQK